MIRQALKCARVGVAVGLAAIMTGCEDGGSGHDFGTNDVNVVVAMGDSITQGYGISGASSYPAQLAGKTGKTVINEGRAGERSASGANRAPALMANRKPGYILILYGINDIPIDSGENIVANLRRIVQAAKANKTVPIVGTLLPTFRSHAYKNPGAMGVNPMIRQMAAEEGVSVADLYDALVDKPDHFQADGLHPNAAGAEVIASRFAGKL